MKIIQDWKKLNNHIPPGFFHAIFLFFADAVRTTTSARTSVAFGASIASAASVLAFVLLREPFVTKPVELLGCFAYYSDLNITNRLVGVTLFMLIALLTFTAFTAFFFSMREREKKALSVIGYCLLPGLFWVASIILESPTTFYTFCLDLSCALCWFALFAFLRERRNNTPTENITITLVAFSLSFFVAPSVLVLIKSPLFWKLSSLINPQHAQETISILGNLLAKMQLLPPLFVFLLWLLFPRRTVFLRFALYTIQISLLFLFCLILPGFFLVDGILTQFFKSGPAFYIIVLPLLIAGVWDCTRRCIFNIRSPISPFPFLALLIFFFLQESPIPKFSNNLFEFGARLPGFWVSFEGWASLLKDVYITYGLWDYAQFLFAWLFSGQHTATTSTYGVHLFKAFVLILEFFAVFSILPVGLAFLLCLIAGVGAQSVVLIFISILLHPRLINKPGVWIGVWLILSAFAPFARIPQGTICVIASFPAFLWQALTLFRQNRQTFWKMTGILMATGFLMIIWPFGEYFWGLIRIFSETAKVNSPWAASVWKIEGWPMIEVLLGNAMLVLPLMSLIGAIIILRRGHRPTKYFVALFLFSFVVVYAFASISYGFSRTDYRPSSRQFQVLVTVLLPLLAGIMAHVRSRAVLSGCLCVLLCLPAIKDSQNFVTSSVLTSPINFLQTARDLPTLAGNKIQNAEDFGMPQLGTGCFPEGYLQEDGVLKKSLDRVLAPKETFLDLTMVGLHYFSSQRKLITEYPVYYVYPGVKPQLRAIEKLRSHNVKVALLEPGYFDDSPSPLRAYYLYRYALLSGLPWEITPTKTLLMPQEYFIKIGLTPPDPKQTLQLLDKQFPMTDFSDLPYVWGLGYQKIVADLRLVRMLLADPVQIHNGIKLALLPPLRGVDAGLLVLNVDMPTYFNGHIKLRWIDDFLPAEINQIQFKAHKGINIVPLDASPRWLLARSITMMTADIVLPQNERKKVWEMQNSLQATPLKLQQQVNCSFISKGELSAKNVDPMVFYSIPDALAGQKLLVRAVFLAPKGASMAQIFYRTATTDYDEIKSEIIPVAEGVNEVYFIIPEEMSIEELRFDPGCIAGDYMINTIEAKPYHPIASSIKISHALLYQRPHIVNANILESR